jgi:hypothetical protein
MSSAVGVAVTLLLCSRCEFARCELPRANATRNMRSGPECDGDRLMRAGEHDKLDVLVVQFIEKGCAVDGFAFRFITERLQGHSTQRASLPQQANPDG